MSANKYPVLRRENGTSDPVPPAIDAPKPHGEALWVKARWTVWRIDGVPTLFERRPVKARYTEKDRPHIHHYDVVPIGPVSAATIACGIDAMDLNEAREAVEFHLHGLTC